MVKETRVHFRRRTPYNTPSHRGKILKTPGGTLTVHIRSKRSNVPHCGDCGCALNGIPAMTSTERHNAKQRENRVARAYGGSRCHKCVRSRIMRSFLVEEQKIAKNMLKLAKPKKADIEAAEKAKKEAAEAEAKNRKAEKSSKKSKNKAAAKSK